MRPRSVADDIKELLTRDQFGRLIDELHNKVLEHIPRYCELPKLVVRQAHFLIDHHNDVHVAFMMFMVPFHGEHALRPGRGLSSDV